MALLEAMAWGLPVVTTPVGGIPDVVTDGEEGLLIKPGDVDGLRAALAVIIGDDARRLRFGERARMRAEAFDVTHFATELAQIYHELGSGKPARREHGP
jgi:glycosyltransferase involved in cell wall biosynthesis